MSAFNVVRFRVKPGCQAQFVEVHRSVRPAFAGYLGGDLIQTGEQTFCIIGKWSSMKALEAARPEMIAVLDRLRDLLEDLGAELGVTDPVSGESVASYKPTKAAAAGKSSKKSSAKKSGSKKSKSKKKDKGRKSKDKGKGKGKRKGEKKKKPSTGKKSRRGKK